MWLAATHARWTKHLWTVAHSSSSFHLRWVAFGFVSLAAGALVGSSVCSYKGLDASFLQTKVQMQQRILQKFLTQNYIHRMLSLSSWRHLFLLHVWRSTCCWTSFCLAKHKERLWQLTARSTSLMFTDDPKLQLLQSWRRQSLFWCTVVES